MEEIKEFVTMAESVAREAGALVAEFSGKPYEIGYKGAADLVTDADRESEKLILGRIRERFPDHAIVAEEGGGKETGSDYRWYVDPLDGTTNFAHGFPMFCTAMALEYKKEIVMGVVFDPLRQELFRAVKGEGAFLNGEPIHVSKIPRLAEGLMATGFPPSRRANSRLNIEYYLWFTEISHGVRRGGSASLDLCYLAAGRLDGFWELKLQPWDKAPGSLIVLEAGGKITDMDGGPFHLYGEPIFASNGLIHSEMGEVFAELRAAHA